MTYDAFLTEKRVEPTPVGLEAVGLPDALFPFQRQIVEWALHRSRAAIFADCGLGKTPMQLAWAEQIVRQTGEDVLILAPLAVSGQTVREGEKFGIAVNPCRELEDVRAGISITNYERLERFSEREWGGLVLDESSILKAFDGRTRQAIQGFAETIPFRLACTATPAPNDLLEIANHSDFVGSLSRWEMVGEFFTVEVQSGERQDYRLKRHAVGEFYRWMNTWAVALRTPRDFGDAVEGFELPPLRVHHHVVDAQHTDDDRLFAVEVRSLTERRDARRDSLEERVTKVCELVEAEPDEPWLIWCHLNAESAALAKAIPGAIEVKGADSPDHKERALREFTDGSIKRLVSKPSIAGHGMNWQNCARVAFCGISDSWEEWYQAIRRCWRFGQERPVDVHVATSSIESSVVENVRSKERRAVEMMDGMVNAMGELRFGRDFSAPVEHEEAEGEGWTMLLGDSAHALAKVEPDSVGLSVYSPPFPGMYVYSATEADVGNCRTLDELVVHASYVMGAPLLRATMPGRLTCVHLKQIPTNRAMDGHVGLRDFRGEVIKMMEDAGWYYHGEATIDKNPQVEATRLKEHGLLFKSLATDAARMRMALADYLLYFRKPGDNPEPIRAGISPKYNGDGGWISQDEWIEWAAPVWYRAGPHYPGGIRETDVLSVREAREERDERHLCPLQLGVIERAVKLWSNPGDLVLSPFAGIGSEGVRATELGRRFIGIELKRSYYEAACRNLRAATAQLKIEEQVPA